MSVSLLDYIENYPTATLNEMKLHLETNFQVHIGKTAISNHLKGKFISIKSIRYSVLDRNSDSVKEIRYNYVKRFLHEGWLSSQCVYIDECSINVWLVRKNGRSRKGQRIYHQLPTQRGPNLSLVLAITKRGPMHYKLVSGSFNHELYQEFITNLSIKLPDTLHYLIHDNASIHNRTLTTSSLHNIIHLPPYSPFLNPIETVFSVVKSKMRTILTNSPGILTSSESEKLNIMRQNMDVLMHDEAFQNLSPYYRHIRKYFPESIEKLDIL